MRLQSRIILCLFALLVGLGSVWAQTRTTPPESLNGLRPGTLTVSELTRQFGAPDVRDTGGLLKLYGGADESSLYGWYMVENPDYTVPDLAVETARGSERVDLVMAIGYGGLRTQKGLACFASEDAVISAYGRPDFVFAVPMQGFVLREFYYVDQGISFDIAPAGQGGERQVIAIYVTYPEFLRRAIDLRKQFISEGTGRDITSLYAGGVTV